MQLSQSTSHNPSSSYSWVQGLTFRQALNFYQYVRTSKQLTENERTIAYVELGRADRFFLLTHILHRADAVHPWLYERCREVESAPDDHIDLWAREHYKSTIITFAGIIQEIIKDPEITIGIFSHTKGIARDFLKQVKFELESNELLKQLYSDVLWQDPKKDAPSWSVDSGITVKRKSNPKEATVEGWGLVDGQPTSKHFRLMIYDDVVTKESVNTPEQILKTTDAWELSRHLSAKDHESDSRRTWYIGTRYNFADTYAVMLARNAAIPRIYPATDNGLPDGKPVFMTQSDWDRKKRESSAGTIACQMLLNPLAGSEQEFKPEWMRRWEVRPETLNVAILGDPANSKKKGSSNSAFAVIGIDAHRNKYLLDGACHRMSLKERWEMLKYLRFKWLKARGVQCVTVGYERYGMQCDIDHFQEKMEDEKCAFPIEEVSWTENRTEHAKDDRIRRLIPDHQNWCFYYPYEGEPTSRMMRADEQGRGFLKAQKILRKDHEGKVYNLVEYFKNNEYLFFPATTLKDFMDAMSRVYDLKINPPQVMREEDLMPAYEGDF